MLNASVFYFAVHFSGFRSKFVNKGNEIFKNPLFATMGLTYFLPEAYIRYFMQYPSVYELFFIARISDIEKKQPTTELLYQFFDTLTGPEWDYCVKQGLMSEEEAIQRQNGLKLTVTGLLLFYLHRRQPVDYLEFLKAMEGTLSFILG
ncbi:MAG: hypothetical protein PHU99_09635 [Candidatus Cloacimonetes bacterium]|jgi:hypothetical protein|nr:hypothetical protein [Bacteroidales bacterium]MDD2261972.1 hypothetical protein [Clostridia bacterium]MDD3097967.1 hypothetical protein [Candidatus Cloacimonadota bacterium]MDD2813824.1 hypothetical protein [Bacteroidales bacterium]MDD3972660.1 hypothetical protein [Clostridia bacterium]